MNDKNQLTTAKNCIVRLGSLSFTFMRGLSLNIYSIILVSTAYRCLVIRKWMAYGLKRMKEWGENMQRSYKDREIKNYNQVIKWHVPWLWLQLFVSCATLPLKANYLWIQTETIKIYSREVDDLSMCHYVFSMRSSPCQTVSHYLTWLSGLFCCTPKTVNPLFKQAGRLSKPIVRNSTKLQHKDWGNCQNKEGHIKS